MKQRDKWNVAYQDFVIVLPGTVNDFPKCFENLSFREECAQTNCQITIDNPPVKDLPPKKTHKQLLKKTNQKKGKETQGSILTGLV